MTVMYTKDYYGNKEHMAKLDSVVVRQYISIVGAVLCFIMFFVLGEVQKQFALEALWDSTRYDMIGMFKILSIILAIILAVTSPIILAEAASKRKKIRNVHLSVGADKVTGTYFPDGHYGEGVRFSVYIRDITYVGVMIGNMPCNNLEIASASGTYKLFCLDNPEGAKRDILEKRDGGGAYYGDSYGSYSSAGSGTYGVPPLSGSSAGSYGTPATAPRKGMISTFKTKPSVPSASAVCPNCGTGVEADSAFCKKCGMKLG